MISLFLSRLGPRQIIGACNPMNAITSREITCDAGFAMKESKKFLSQTDS
jgi:hypothetical protein